MGTKEASTKEIVKPPKSSSSSSTLPPHRRPLPPPLPKCWAMSKAAPPTWSVTKKEIDKYWRRKRMEEEDHLFAAIKSAARIRARNLTMEDYRQFEESLKGRKMEKEDRIMGNCSDDQDENNNEIRVGIKDWWTKSKYAYLNEPVDAIRKDRSRRASNYIPDNCLYNYKPLATLIH